jgi:hypothetical protein
MPNNKPPLYNNLLGNTNSCYPELSKASYIEQNSEWGLDNVYVLKIKSGKPPSYLNCTAFWINTDGKIYQYFHPDYWAENSSIGIAAHQKNIAIEIVNHGPLVTGLDARTFFATVQPGFASDPDNGLKLANVGETNNADTTARDGFDENSYSDIKYYYNRNQKFPVKVFTGNIEKLEAGKYL